MKNLSNPYSTGGGGIFFENHIQTAFTVLMLAGGFLPFLPGKKIEKLRLQSKNIGIQTDDIVAYTSDSITNIKYKMLAQIKHDISIINSDAQFQEVISAAWEDFNNPSVFNKGRDVIALITGPLSKSDIYDTRTILEWARHSENADDFFEQKINLSNFSSNTKREKVQVFRNILKIANNNEEVSAELVYSFLRHFYLIGYDLDIKSGVTHSLLTSIINQFQNNDSASSIWSKISEEISFVNQTASIVSLDTLPDEIQNYFKSKREHEIPKDYSKPTIDEYAKAYNMDRRFAISICIAAILGGWNQISPGDLDIIDEVTGGF